MLKKAVSKAAGESKPEAYPLGYVEDFDEPRTPLEAIFNILLFHRHALGQIPWLIHIRAAQHCNMIRQELEWNRK